MTKPKQRTPSTAPQITVAGITFSAEMVKSAVVVIDGRDIFIGEKEEAAKKVGFPGAKE